MPVESEHQIPTLERSRTALVFVEFQREWVSPNGALRTLLVSDEGQFQRAIDNGARVLTSARKYGWTVTHAPLDLRADPEYKLFGPSDRALGLRKAIQVAGTWTGPGAEFPEPFAPMDGEYVVRGRSGASVLTNSTLDAFLRNNDLCNVVLLGFATHICIESSLRQAHDLGYRAYVVNDATGAFEDHQNAYFNEHVLPHFGAGLSTAQLLDFLESSYK